MTAVTFDTHWAIKQLISKGISQDQAEVFVDVIRESKKADRDGVATKADLAELKAELIKWMFSGFIAILALLVTILLKLH